jgi:DNA repair exonuclease SbcCD ATPase subunit
VKIQGWSVERFGALRNYEVRDLPAGLTVFCGPNGSGKSTLVAFIRQMLFGQTRSDENGQRPAFAQDGWSGRLYVSGPGGVYTIARKADRPNQISVTRPDGSEASDTELERLFGGHEGRLIGSSLAFDIGNLQTLPALSNPGIRERMFPAGAGRGLRAIQHALETIQARKAETANTATRDLQMLTVSTTDLQARIDRSTRAAARLGQLLQSHTQAQGAFDMRTRTIADLRADVTKYETLVELAPVWQELTHARRELETLGPVEQFPPDPEQRLEQALAARQAAQRTVAQLVGRDGGTPAPQTTVARPQTPPRIADQIAGSAEDLTGWQRRLKEAAEAARESEADYENTSRTVRELELARNELSAILGRPEPPNAATLDEEARLVQQVRTTLAGLESDQTFTKRWQDQIAERSAAIRNLETQVIRIPSRALSYLGWIAAVAGIAGAAWSYAAHDMIVMAVLAGASLLSVAGAALQQKRRHSAIEEEGDRRSQLDDARGELERACQSLLHHQERASRRQFDISVASVRLGLPQMPTDLQLKEREAEIEAQRRNRDEWDKAQATFDEQKSTLARNEELRRQKAQAMMAAQAHERQTIQQWNQWKVHGQSDSGTSQRQGAESVRSESELLETCRRLRVQIAEWEQNATEWNTRARAALVGIAEPEAATGGTATAVMVAQPAAEQSPALKAARRRLQHCEEALIQLFSQAGVSDENAYRARLATHRRRSTLQQMIRSCEARYNERLRREAAPDALQRELNDGNIEEWRQRSTRSAAELSELETARDEIMRQLRQLEADIASARAESAELPVLEAERAALATEALASTRASRALVVAGALLEDTRRHIERESQPPAIRRASESLSAITFSRYERVGQSDDQQELTVLDTKNGWTPVTQLSRGALDQLYFSLRVGLAADAEQQGARPPVVIDDVLDHFDPKRSQAMARQIVDLSRRHQVFVFTRRPETSDLLRSLDPTANLMTLQEL